MSRNLECSVGLCPVRMWCGTTLASEPIVIAGLEKTVSTAMIEGAFLDLEHEEDRGDPTITEGGVDPEVSYLAVREYWNPDRSTKQLHRAQERLRVAKALAPIVSQDCAEGIAVRYAHPLSRVIVGMRCEGEMPEELRTEQARIAAAQVAFSAAKREATLSNERAPDSFDYGL